ncbi:hypothetical protein QU481_16520 [Crenobacter sp. SG2303]|uniref:Glycosyl hydrolase family 4 C-terminal domain-containing protein n=1 Tax=Crenobacter oryzisoli TaxID=3056844 RepID=A0ABT7XRW9_9NEIS|nr:hypothetical protein [Crenobacter sp. SG2303]MDN0076475.1 hypothetical protein [Crenobacter sp. SG2303]
MIYEKIARRVARFTIVIALFCALLCLCATKLSTIIHAIEANMPAVIYGNVLNDALIDNLPAGCCVEVPCLVDGSGVRPTRVGKLPPQLAALMRTNVNVQELTVEAVLTGKHEHVYHAAILDPHTAAELDAGRICEMVDALLEAHQPYLPPAFFA